MNKLLIALLVSTWGAMAHATSVAYSGPFVGREGTAVIKGGAAPATFTRDMNTTGDRVSLEIVTSTYSIVVSTQFGSANYTVNTPTITIVGNNFTTGFQVLFSTAALPPIGGLTLGTTYFVSVINPNTLGVSSTFKLATTSTGAVAGLGIPLTSSTTTTNRYTLTPLAFTNVSGGIQIQWSDDNSTFFNSTTGNYNAAISSVTFTGAGTNTLYDLGPTNHRYLRLNVIAPPTGAVNYTATDNERYSYNQ